MKPFVALIKIRMILLFAALYSASLGGCASAPRFEPSRPIPESRSLREGLLLCDEYEAPVEDHRVISLRPYLDCSQELAERFPEQAVGDFDLFLRELRKTYGSLKDWYWTPELGAQIRTAIRALYRALWQGRRGEGGATAPYTQEERSAVLKHFPKTAEALGARRWHVFGGELAGQAAYDPDLEALRAGVASLAPRRPSPAVVPSEAETPVAAICLRVEELTHRLEYLGSLWLDQREMTALAPNSEVSDLARRKYQRALDQATEELNLLRREIFDLRANGTVREFACNSL